MTFDRKNRAQRRDRYVASGEMNSLDYSELVNAESLERELQRVRAAAAGDAQGAFGPRSVTWQIDQIERICGRQRNPLFLKVADDAFRAGDRPLPAAQIARRRNRLRNVHHGFHRALQDGDRRGANRAMAAASQLPAQAGAKTQRHDQRIR